MHILGNEPSSLLLSSCIFTFSSPVSLSPCLWSVVRRALPHNRIPRTLRAWAGIPGQTTRSRCLVPTPSRHSQNWNGNILIIQWWFVNPDTFVPGQYFRINEFSGLLNRPSVQKRKLVPALFVRISEISGLSEPGLTNHHCTLIIINVILYMYLFQHNQILAETDWG